MSYDADEQFFSKEDVPEKAKIIRDQVKDFIDPDLLGLRKKEWNNSVAVPKNPLLEETHERKLVKIKLGLFDQPVPSIKEPHIEPGTDTRNDYTGWNVSTELDERARKAELEKQTMIATIKNKEMEQELIKSYKDPVKKQVELGDSLRQKKMREKEYRDQIRSEFKFANPAASEQKTDGAVFRLAYETKLKKQQFKNDPTLTFKPDMSKTLKNEVRYKTHHTGI